MGCSRWLIGKCDGMSPPNRSAGAARTSRDAQLTPIVRPDGTMTSANGDLRTLSVTVSRQLFGSGDVFRTGLAVEPSGEEHHAEDERHDAVDHGEAQEIRVR